MLTHEDIIKRAQPADRTFFGVYFLIRNARVVYVGSYSTILWRLGNHRRSKKPHDAWAYVECSKAELRSLERQYIKALKPELNVLGVVATGRPPEPPVNWRTRVKGTFPFISK